MALISPMNPKLLLPALFICAAVSVSAQDWAKAKLEKSPRHMEYVTVTNGTRAVDCWVVYPEVKDKATAVLVIHDSSGLTDWARLSADEIAAAGYIAIAPDFLSGAATNGGGTSSFPGQNELAVVLKKLPTDQVIGDLNAAAEYVKALVTVTVPDGVKDMKSAGKIFEPVIYEGAGHGFMAHGDPEFPDATPADRKARDQSWDRLKDLLKKI
jgi:dienelactone hydrolase